MPKLKEGRLREFNYRVYAIPLEKLEMFDEAVKSVEQNKSNAKLGGKIADIFAEYKVDNAENLRVIIEEPESNPEGKENG